MCVPRLRNREASSTSTCTPCRPKASHLLGPLRASTSRRAPLSARTPQGSRRSCSPSSRCSGLVALQTTTVRLSSALISWMMILIAFLLVLLSLRLSTVHLSECSTGPYLLQDLLTSLRCNARAPQEQRSLKLSESNHIEAVGSCFGRWVDNACCPILVFRDELSNAFIFVKVSMRLPSSMHHLPSDDSQAYKHVARAAVVLQCSVIELELLGGPPHCTRCRAS